MALGTAPPAWAVGPSYGDVVVEALTRYPGRDAFVSGDRRATYAEIADLVGRTQTVLDDLGLRTGGAVGVLSPNAPEVFVVQTATVLNGARYTGLHPLSSLEDHVFLCDDAGIEILVAHPAYAERAASVAERAQQAFGPVLHQGYGQSESIGMGMALRKDEHAPVGRPELLTSCGRPVAGVRIELQDDDGVPVGDGEVGELCIRSRAVMNGYWRRDEESEQALRGGWLRTSDLAVRDASGFLHLVDRKKDMIISGGFNVYPREIEDVLTEHESVSQAAVVGVPDEKWGEAVAAFVVGRAGVEVDVDALTALVRERKGSHQAPKRVEIVPELPTTGVGKIDKKALRATLWAGQARNVH